MLSQVYLALLECRVQSLGDRLRADLDAGFSADTSPGCRHRTEEFVRLTGLRDYVETRVERAAG